MRKNINSSPLRVIFLISIFVLSSCTLLPVPAPTPTSALNYENPVFPHDFPDPFILRVGDTYYGYATNARNLNVQVIHSTDLIHWEYSGDEGEVLPELPDWAAPGQLLTWAPSVLQRGDKFILYYVTRYVAGGRQCISYAVSTTPEGPFVDPNEQPFICQLEEGGSIDPEPFLDHDDQLYLLWKSDGNCCNLPLWIYAQQLAADGRSLVGQPHRLITRDQEWEKPVVENPSMIFQEGHYYLIYSANWWESGDYGVGYAVCDSSLGPCRKPQHGPILTSIGPRVRGPGGATFFRDVTDNLWLAYHAWASPNIGYPAGQRRLHLGQVTFADGTLLIYRPEAQKQPSDP